MKLIILYYIQYVIIIVFTLTIGERNIVGPLYGFHIVIVTERFLSDNVIHSLWTEP